jgi:Cd2+/Zn2+-exporting ATPase
MNQVNKISYYIEGMECPMEEMLIRDQLNQLEGIEKLVFDLINNELTIYHHLSHTHLFVEAIAKSGMQAKLITSAKKTLDKSWFKLILAGVLALSAEIVGWTVSSITWLPVALAILAILIGGLSTYRRGWIALLHGRLNINALISVAATGALLLQAWSEAAMTLILYVLAERIEARSIVRTNHTIHSLMTLSPKQAEVLQPSGQWQLVAVANITAGSMIRLKPGECVPLDGIVRVGSSTINQASISGESMPVRVKPNDKLFAGSINQEGEIEYIATADESHSVLARMVHNTEFWQANRAPAERWIERFARIYTPVIFGLAILMAIIPPIFDGLWSDWLYRSLVLLVTACPCALVIAIPATIVSGLTLAMRHGILIKGGVFLEQGRLLDYLVFDKTGTLTLGKPVVNEFVPINPHQESTLAIAVALAKRSEHPFSKAIVDYQEKQAISVLPLQMQNILATPGCGIAGDFNKVRYYLGSEQWIGSCGIPIKDLNKSFKKITQLSKSIVILSNDKSILAIFIITDKIRSTSRNIIQWLHRMGLKTLMLSGDNANTSKNIANQLGIMHVKSNLLPTKKAKIIANLIKKHHHVGMIGDGVNDVPALVCASIGFAMAKEGADATVGAADVVFMDDNLCKIPAFVFLSRHTMAVLKQNITLALGIKLLFIFATIFGYGTMWGAVVADMGTNLLVTANGLRILRKRLPDFL